MSAVVSMEPFSASASESGGAGEAAPASDAEPRIDQAKVARFRALVDAHFAFIWRSLRGLGVPHAVVDDAAQQVFVVALEKLDLITLGSERSFLFGTALGVAANARRARARSREIQDEAAVLERADASPDPEEAANRKQLRAALDEILARLPIELSTVFILFELEGLTMSEISVMLDLAPGTVASRLRRAREEFRAHARRLQDVRPEAAKPRGGTT